MSLRFRSDAKNVEAAIRAHVTDPSYICRFTGLADMQFVHLPQVPVSRSNSTDFDDLSHHLTSQLDKYRRAVASVRHPKVPTLMMVPHTDPKPGDHDTAWKTFMMTYRELVIASTRLERVDLPYFYIRSRLGPAIDATMARGIDFNFKDFVTVGDRDFFTPYFGPNYLGCHYRYLPHALVQAISVSALKDQAMTHVRVTDHIVDQVTQSIWRCLLGREVSIPDAKGFEAWTMARKMTLTDGSLPQWLKDSFLADPSLRMTDLFNVFDTPSTRLFAPPHDRAWRASQAR